MESQSANELLSELRETILRGKSERSLELLDKVFAMGVSFETIVAKSILEAHLAFNEWYKRDRIGSLKAWEFCFFATVKVLKAIDSRIPPPQNPPFSVLVATVYSEGHITMRDVIATLLRSKGLRVYGMKKGIRASDIDGPLLDKSLKYVVLSCSEDATKPVLDDLIMEIRARRPDVKIIAGGAMAHKSGADIVLNDPLELYSTMLSHLK